MTDYIKNLTVTDLEELSYIDYEDYSIKDLEILFEHISLTIDDLEIKEDILSTDNIDTSDIEDNIYNLECLQYDVQNTIESKEV